MKRKSINNAVAVLVFLLFTTTFSNQFSFLSSQSLVNSSSQNFSESINVNDPASILCISTAGQPVNKISTTIQLPK